MEEFSAKGVAGLYRACLEVEVGFRKLKSEYSSDMIATKNPGAVKALVWPRAFTRFIQRIRFVTILEFYSERVRKMSHERIIKLFREKTAGITFNVCSANPVRGYLMTVGPAPPAKLEAVGCPR